MACCGCLGTAHLPPLCFALEAFRHSFPFNMDSMTCDILWQDWHVCSSPDFGEICIDSYTYIFLILWCCFALPSGCISRWATPYVPCIMQRDGSLSYGTLALQEGRSMDTGPTWIWLVELWIRFRISCWQRAEEWFYSPLFDMAHMRSLLVRHLCVECHFLGRRTLMHWWTLN